MKEKTAKKYYWFGIIMGIFFVYFGTININILLLCNGLVILSLSPSILIFNIQRQILEELRRIKK